MKTETLSCKLNETQIRERGEALAKLRKEIAEIDSAAKSSAANFKSAKEGKIVEADSITEEISTKSEYRSVEVTEEKNFDTKKAYTIRLDTSETIRTRDLTPQELQRPIPFESVKKRSGAREEASA